MSDEQDFLFSESREPHRERTKAILRRHPEVRTLIGNNPFTFLFIVGLVALQIGTAMWVRHYPWWLLLIVAYTVGAFANHALYVLNHECSHNLVFKKKIWNMLAGIISDFPTLVPGSTSFRLYHLKHHSFQGVYELDADIPSKWEAKLIGNTPYGKIVWLLFFPVFQVTRPQRIKELKFANRWTYINIAIVLLFDLFVLLVLGPKAFVYFLLSLFFSIGLHPLGARWIQEHYVVKAPQETYSYYGILNHLAFNVGYHNEHHDLPSIPWNRLPALRKAAPEFYNSLYYHKSWVKLLVKFLFDPRISLFSRVERKERGGVTIDAVA